MKYQIPAVTTLLMATASAAAPVQANQELEAKAACERVMTRFEQEQADNRDSSVLDLVEQCRINVRSKAYWECAEDRMENGESFAFATNQCNKLDPQ